MRDKKGPIGSSYYLCSVPLVQVNFFWEFSSGVFSVITVYYPVLYFVRIGETGEFYLEAFWGAEMSNAN